MLGIIIQARLGATRLPYKMIKPFFGVKGIFEILLDRLIEASLGTPLILATTERMIF